MHGGPAARIAAHSAANVTVSYAATHISVMNSTQRPVVGHPAPVRVDPTPAVGIEAPAERAGERSGAYVGVSECPWIPVPSRTSIRTGVIGSHLVISLSHVLRSQAVPVVKIVFRIVRVEFLRLRFCTGAQYDLVVVA